MVRICTLACVLATASWSVDHALATSRPRRVLQADDNIGEKIKEEHSNGVHQPAFHIRAVVESGGADGGIEDLGVDVVELQPAVTIDTVVEMYDDSGPALGVGKAASRIQTVSQALGDDETLSTILVTDPESSDIEEGTFAVLAVDLKNDMMHGYVEKKADGDKKAFQLKQEREAKDGKTSAQEESDGAGMASEFHSQPAFSRNFSSSHVTSICSLLHNSLSLQIGNVELKSLRATARVKPWPKTKTNRPSSRDVASMTTNTTMITTIVLIPF